MTSAQKKVIIIGGGITGLAAAYALQELARKNQAPVSFTLIEGQPRLGGKILTDTDHGFVIEGGPDSFISQKPWALELCRQLGLENRLTGTNREQTATYILHHGRLVNLPEGLMLLVPTRLRPLLSTPLFSPTGKLRMGMDWIIPKKRGTEDESLAGFVRRRLGREAVERLAEPLLAGIYAGDAEQMSLAATFPQFMELEQRHGSLIRGMLARRREMRGRTPSGREPSPGTIPTTMFMTLKGGLSELVTALVSKLDQNALMIGTEAERIHWKSGLSTYHVRLKDGTTMTADAVIAASPAYVTADLLAETDATLVRSLREIPYVSTATVSLAYRKDSFRHPLNGFGFVVPRSEGRSIMACTWTSTKFPHRSPENRVLLRCFVGGVGREDIANLAEKEMVNAVRDDLRAIMNITEEPILSRVYRWEKANPQYPVGHLDRLAGIDDRLTRLPGLFLAGAAYRGVGVPDCIRQGNNAAERAFAYLTARQ
ncbi:MAG: protoporphyrinogen oxidase [Nitrospirae bacterium]|nr:protoporphyrinogen oxidase [Nitrospirota bacterium]